jgi:hypothetical protein
MIAVPIVIMLVLAFLICGGLASGDEGFNPLGL